MKGNEDFSFLLVILCLGALLEEGEAASKGEQQQRAEPVEGSPSKTGLPPQVNPAPITGSLY